MTSQKIINVLKGGFGILKKYALLLFFIVIILIFFLFKIDLAELVRYISRFTFWQITLLISLNLIMLIVLILRYKYLIVVTKLKAGIKNIALVVFSSLIAQYTAPGKIGYPVTAILFKKTDQISYSDSSAFLLTDYAFGIFFSSMIALFGSLLIFKKYVMVITFGFIILLLVMIALFFVLQKVRKRNKANKITDFIHKFVLALKHFKLRHFIVLFVLNVVNLLLSTWIFYLSIEFLGFHVPYIYLMFIDMIAFFLGAISMIPMGLGVQEASILFFLSSYGIPKETGFVVAFIKRIVYLVPVYILGFISGMILGIKDVRKK